jgi:DNA uptake protein ComE-like DNA-binding protein
MAAGEPICWWTADNALFTNIPGVGPSLAERISNYRNSGGEFSLVGLQSIRGVGPSVADQALDEVTTACAHVFAH